MRNGTVWAIEWTPITNENTESFLIVGSWDQSISFYDHNGKQIGLDKNIGFDPLSLNFLGNGEFFVISGTNNKASLWTKEGNFIGNVCEKQSWIWTAKVMPNSWKMFFFLYFKRDFFLFPM